MRTFEKIKRLQASTSVQRRSGSYVHHPINNAVNIQRTQLRTILRSNDKPTKADTEKPEIQNDDDLGLPVADFPVLTTAGIPPDRPNSLTYIQRTKNKESTAERQRQPEEEDEPIQTMQVQRQAEDEEGEPIQARRIQRKVTDLNRNPKFRFSRVRPEAKMQRVEIGRILRSTGVQDQRRVKQIDFPYRTMIQSALRYTLPDQALVDSRADILGNKQAMTVDDTSIFSNEQPPLKIAAHEATHIMQHSGKTRDFDLGAEQHADLVSKMITQKHEPSRIIGARGKTVNAKDAHAYTEYDSVAQMNGDWAVGVPVRVSDNGETLTDADGGHLLYAEPAAISATNSQLASQGSGVTLNTSGNTISGPIPDGGGNKVLNQVSPTFSVTSSSTLWYTDCGISAHDVTSGRQVVAPRALYQDTAGQQQETRASSYPAYHTQSEFYRQEILAEIFPGSADPEADYRALSPAQRDIYDSQYGLNQYAQPGVGEMFHEMRDESVAPPGAGHNFHWAAVILRPGHDFVTLENAAVPGCAGPGCFNENWKFQTYGPPTRAGQTFHEQWATRVGSTSSDSMTVTTTTTDSQAEQVALLISHWASASPTKRATLLRKFQALSIRIRVVMGITGDISGDDEVLVEVTAPGGFSHTSTTRTMIQGQMQDFIVPLNRITTIPSTFQIRVKDDDSFLGTRYETMVSIDWPRPFSATRNTSTASPGRYFVTVELSR